MSVLVDVKLDGNIIDGYKGRSLTIGNQRPIIQISNSLATTLGFPTTIRNQALGKDNGVFKRQIWAYDDAGKEIPIMKIDRSQPDAVVTVNDELDTNTVKLDWNYVGYHGRVLTETESAFLRRLTVSFVVPK